jgi:hypothetical protein
VRHARRQHHLGSLSVIRKVLLGSALLMVLLVALYVRFRQSAPPLETAYAGSRTVTLYSTSAQVREQVATVSFGDRLEVLQRFQNQVKVRTAAGVIGWTAEGDLLSADLWQTLNDLGTKSATMPVVARGHTRVLSNLHIEPGRDSARVRQLNKDIPIEMMARQPEFVAPAAIPSATGIAEDESLAAPASEPAKPAARKAGRKSNSSKSLDRKSDDKPASKKEDWWLVRAHLADRTVLAGWLLGRFVELDVPSPLPDYATSAGMRIVAWTELNRVPSESSKPVMQYLLLGTHGPEGQPCDFTALRVYTWGKQKGRYETAFVESNVCGKLPIQRLQSAGPEADITFSFLDSSNGAPERRTYQMHQTIVRRVNDGSARKPRKRAR